MERMLAAFTVLLYMLFVGASATAPILVSECSTLNVPFATYRLANNIEVNNSANDGFVCFDITSNGITLDGNGFEISPASHKHINAIGVQFSGKNVIVTNLQIANLRTGIHAKGTYGQVTRNIITGTVNGIDVSAPHNEISHNTIKGAGSADVSSGIYVYFPSMVPTAAHVSITNNVISNIQGEDFAIGISVYYATAVNIAYNRIFNLQGGFAKEISVIGGEAEVKGNVFRAATEEGTSFPLLTTILLSCAAILVSALWFFALAGEKEKEKERRMEMQKAKEKRAEEEQKVAEEKKAEGEKEKERRKEEIRKAEEEKKATEEASTEEAKRKEEEETARKAKEEEEKLEKAEEERIRVEKEEETIRMEKEKEEEKVRMEKEKEEEGEIEMDGADEVIRPSSLSFSVGSSPVTKTIDF